MKEGMSGEVVQSIGEVGRDFGRSEGRAYYNVENTVTNYQELVEMYTQFAREGMETHGRRRIVLRARCTKDVIDQLLLPTNQEVPLEVILPLSSIEPENTDGIVTLGQNVHQSEVPEWGAVYQYWQYPNGNGRTPSQRIDQLDHQRFALVNQPTVADIDSLAEIWRPFGWTRTGIEYLIGHYQAEGKFFSGIFDKQQQRLVSACLAEGMELAGVDLFEGTEYGTLPSSEYRGHGLCTAAVIGLNAQIMQARVYGVEQPRIPLTLSEFSMSSRSDIVGRHAGMTIPYIEGSRGYENTPFQVLRYNVSVRDDLEQNDIRWGNLNMPNRDHYRDAFRTIYPYWRNFIVGILPKQAMEEQYSREQVSQMLSHVETRS